MSTPSRFKKDKEIIAEYESQVKGKDGSGRLAPFVCFLVIVLSGSCISNLGSATEGGCEGHFERLAEPPGASSHKTIPVPIRAPSNPRELGTRWFSLAASAHLLKGFNLTTAFDWATYMGGRQHQRFLPSSPVIMIPIILLK